MSTSAITMAGLWRTFGRTEAVRDVSLDVAEGECFLLIGPAGAGKTTLSRLLAGTLAPSAGTVGIAGRPCFADRADLMRCVGYAPARPGFTTDLRTRDVLALAGSLHGLDGEEIRTRATDLAGPLGLLDDLESFPVHASPAVRKKLALACAFLHAPDVLILDEPTADLDANAAAVVREMLQACASTGRTVFVTAAALGPADVAAHRVGVLAEGRLVAAGGTGQIRRWLADEADPAAALRPAEPTALGTEEDARP